MHMQTIMKIIFTIKNNNDNNKIWENLTKKQNHKISNEKEKQTHIFQDISESYKYIT